MFPLNFNFPFRKSNGELTTLGRMFENAGGISDINNEIADIVNVLGAKNLLPNSATSKTLNGVTFNVNNDGSVTINGTATSNTFFYLVGNSVTESGYKLSGKFIVSTQNYISQNSYLRIGKTSGEYTNVTEKKVISFSENSDIYATIRIANGEVINNVTLYPMLRLASIEDDTYRPYAMTNRELTDAVASLQNAINALNNG